MIDKPYVMSHQVLGFTCMVRYSDGSVRFLDAIKLGCEWFTMSNDAFFALYGFNFNPHQWGLYDHCRRLVHGSRA